MNVFKLISKLLIALGVFFVLSACGDKTYTVSFDSQGGTEVDNIEVAEEVSIELPTPEKEGYLFVEWQLDDETFTNKDVVTGNITLKAIWEDISVLNYDIQNEQVIIKGYTGESRHLILPSKINGYIVTEIANQAFEDSSIESIKIPNSVHTIGIEAFLNASHLESISFYGDYIGTKEMYFTETTYDQIINENADICVSHSDPDYPDDDTKWVFPEGCPIRKVMTKYPEGDQYHLTVDVALYETKLPSFIGGADVFQGTALKSFEIPRRYKHVEFNERDDIATLFKGINTLENISVHEDNPYYTSENGVLFNKDKTQLIFYPTAKKDSHFRIPSGVQIIPSNAFSDTTALESIEIPNSVFKIEDNAFYNMNQLLNISFYGDYTGIIEYEDRPARYQKIIDDYIDVCVKSPDPDNPNDDSKWILSEGCPVEKVRKISENRYHLVVNLAYYDTLSVPMIYHDAFKGTSIKTLEMSSRFGSINFLWEMEQLQSITIDENNPYYSIEDGVLFNKDKTKLYFYLPTKLDTQYVVPESVIEISPIAFYNAVELESITIHEDNPNYSSEDGVLFNKDKTELIFYPSGKKDSHYVVPTGITEITDFSFSNPSALVTIELPASVTSIDGLAFSEAESFQNIVLHGTATELIIPYDREPFINSDILIYVPDVAIYDYKRMDGWSEYASRIKSMIIWDYLNQ